MHSSLLASFALTIATSVAVAQEPTPAPTVGRLRTVRITTQDVFAPDVADARPLAALVNAVHATTREEVIARELWFAPGDRIDAAQAAELERNLRALGLFAEVTVRLVPTGTPEEVDLEIDTKDHLTLSFGGGASYVGGVTGFRAALGESNILGHGNRLVASFSRNSEDEYRGALAYTDLHVLDSWHTGTVRLARTDDGDSIGLELRRPFKHLTDPRSYSFATSHEETRVDYYRAGDSVAEVPDVRTSFASDLLWSEGPAHRRRITGLELAVEHHDHEPAIGPLAPEIRVPGDTLSLFFGPTARWQWIDDHRKVEGIDTLAYVQDVQLGTNVGVTIGGRWRDEEGRGGELQPEIATAAGWLAEPIDGVFTNVTARGGLRWSGDTAVGWNGSAAARAFARLGGGDTLGASIAFDAIEEDQDLPIELTLGEDNGLRGYTARGFAGTRRLRTNVENRFDTGIELATLHLGLVAFFDSGWVGRDGDLGRPFTSAGFGLRIGSKELFGGGVLRIDVALPFDAPAGEDDGWQVSVSAGQVFGLQGYTNTLSVR